MPIERIDHCYDSHVHWLATGEMQSRLDLRSLKKAEDVASLLVLPQHFKDRWLIGFGWDESLWSSPDGLNRKTLDRQFPDHPVCFSRVDGHTVWLNSKALEELGWLRGDLPQFQGGKIIMDDTNTPTGIAIDSAANFVRKQIPKANATQVAASLLQAVRVFNNQGITHIRDMTCSIEQWSEAVRLDDSGLLTLAVEQFFSADDPADFDDAFELALQARKTTTPRLRAKGLKVYYDGALGSEGAFLSQDYPSGSGRGLVLIEPSELKQMLRRSWEQKFDIAVHTIGDQAAQDVVEVACQLWDKGFKGHLHLEHAQVLRPETVSLLVGKTVTCHLQPSHWLSDKRWLKEKLGSLYEFSFPWRQLQEAEIEFYFGSDSPIEPADIPRSLSALNDSALHGIPKLLGPGLKYHTHPDPTWVPGTFSEFSNDQVKAVVFQGKHLF
ncbi:MAG: amidohydrolase family protein [Pseudobdellovibrionaceae bacterium]|nr:amidohydrolase family protein [Bdellovibrionales bacterium]USN47347.1 MAG: amidohydrolase family protein [Pseudobdellovibrionaceae bacterium]